MASVTTTDNIPPRVMDLLRIFLAASSRGEQAVLVLETSKTTVTTKYRSVETLAGAPATTNAYAERKRNPARARRSHIRLDEFMRRKKEKEK